MNVTSLGMKRHLLLVTLLGTAMPVAAQAPLDAGATTAARQSLVQYAACLVSRDDGRVARLITLPVDSAEYRRSALRLYESSNDVCSIDGALRYNPVLFSGALFEALYKRDFGYSGPVTISTAITTGYADRYRPPHSLEVRQAIALESFGECVSRADAAGAHKLMLVAPATAAEQQQFTVLAPHFRTCVVNGAKVEMSKSLIRGAIAEGLYRLSRAAVGQGAAK